jgi:hypothetical protein
MIGEGQLVGVGRLRLEIGQASIFRALCRYLEQLRALIHGRNSSVRYDAMGNADAGLAGAAGEIENLHAGLGAGVLDERLGDRASHKCRLGLPFFGGGDTGSRTPRG